MKKLALGLSEARDLTLAGLSPLPAEKVGLLDAAGRVAARGLSAQVDSPTEAVSRKDGFAVTLREVAQATPEHPVSLRVLGVMTAGGREEVALAPGGTVKVFTGARLPRGTDAVVPEEQVRPAPDGVLILNPVRPGLNVLPRGSDVAAGRALVQAGEIITPVRLGLLAAAGVARLAVYGRPRVGIVGIGDELVEPGRPLAPGKVYASNIVTLAGLCQRYGFRPRLTVVADEHGPVAQALTTLSPATDVVITSGGAWFGDRDIVAGVLESLGWEQVFHRIRIGPGKAVGFGRLAGKPVFILPGGPPSNLMGFLQIALPGLLTLAGWADPGLPQAQACLAEDLGEGHPAWTDFFFGTLFPGPEVPLFHPLPKRCRLGAIAQATAVAAIPEGQDRLPAGTRLAVQLLA
ncbi:MAG: molybdopterin molybdotransferase MoeA [Deltaproteobacteria bacterium]|nr:molybdopterin molybdotransferase MoeA [Deltaproteobacteria bacterium]